jgi:hypothetical protein
LAGKTGGGTIASAIFRRERERGCSIALLAASAVTTGRSLWINVDNSSELVMWKARASWQAFDHQFPGC